MKRIIRNLFLILLIFYVPVAMTSGQEKKNEKKIKVIVDDGSGAKTVLDTAFTGTPLPEKIELKDGTVIFIGEPEMGLEHITDGKKVIVTVDADKDGEKHLKQKVIVMSSDSAKWTASSAGDKGHIYVYSQSGNIPEKQIFITSTGYKMPEWEDEEGLIIRHGKVIRKEGNDSFSIVVKDEDWDSDATKYVIAKDGVVVTIECDDEAKAKDIIKVIEGKLGVKNEEGDVKDKKTQKK